MNVFLLVLLIASNAFWFVQMLDKATTESYRNDSLVALSDEKKQATDMLSQLIIGQPKADIVALFTAEQQEESFEKDGCLWIGHFGFQFNEQDRLTDFQSSSTIEHDSLCQ